MSTAYETRRRGHNRYRELPANPDAGIVLKAVDALRNPDVQHFTRAQVAHLLSLAFLSGAEHRRAHDVAELIATWDEKFPGDTRCTIIRPHTKRVRDARKQMRMAEYERLAELRREQAAWTGRPQQRTRLDCDWPEVALPGSGLPQETT